MKCPKCQFENREGIKFCEECGAKMELKCPNCGVEIPLGRKFCGECGHKLEQEAVPKPEPSIEGERKQVTVLFSDLSGYTDISEKLDPEEVKKIMSQIFGKVTQVVGKYDGSIQKFIGDAVVAFFGVPKAHEDDSIRAIRAAIEIHEIVNVISHHFETTTGRPLTAKQWAVRFFWLHAGSSSDWQRANQSFSSLRIFTGQTSRRHFL